MNWKDKTIFIGDNLHIMRGMNSDSVDLIYLDPPFNSNRNCVASTCVHSATEAGIHCKTQSKTNNEVAFN